MLSLENEQKYKDLEKKYLLVEISEQKYAFNLAVVKEVIPIIEIFSIESDTNIAGVINLRGESVPVVDLKSFFSKGDVEINSKQKLVILQLNSNKLAILVDNLFDILDIEEDKLVKLPSAGNFLSSTVINEKTISVINSYDFFSFFIGAAAFIQEHSLNLIPTESTSLSSIKKHTEIINQKDHYSISEDAFLNEKYIIFRLNQEIYAFNILYIEMINTINVSAISRIPCVPEFIKGIINIKGDYLSLLDIKPFLNIVSTGTENKMEIVIIRVNSLRLAIIVDEILTIDKLPISKMVSLKSGEDSFIKGEINSDGKVINILDVEKLFSSQNVDIENYEN